MVSSAYKVNTIIGRSSAINIANSGGTEEIARYLNNIHNCNIVYEEKIHLKYILSLFKDKDSRIFLLGSSKILIFKILLLSLIYIRIPKIEYIKTTHKNNKKDLLLSFLLLNVFKKIHVADLDGSYFKKFPQNRKRTINIPELITVNLKYKSNFKHEVSLSSRGIDIGYIGRIDAEKGFFKAVEIFQNNRLKNFKKLCDVLVWDDNKDIKIINDIEEKNFPNLVFNKNFKSSNSLPNYHNIKIVLLPYKNFNSTIRVPLVIFEALCAGCLVFLPNWIKKDEKVIEIINEFQIIFKGDSNLFFYDSNEDALISSISSELENILEKKY